jgi:hypothetical protein
MYFVEFLSAITLISTSSQFIFVPTKVLRIKGIMTVVTTWKSDLTTEELVA